MECKFTIVDDHNPEVWCRITATVQTRRGTELNLYDVGYTTEYHPSSTAATGEGWDPAMLALQLFPLSGSHEMDNEGVIVPANACTTALVGLLCAPVDAVLHAGGRRLRPLLGLPRTPANEKRKEQAAACYRGVVMRALAQFWD